MINIENKLTELGFIIKGSIKQNRINRCSTVSQPSKKNGWFRVFDNSVSYGDWAGNIESGYFWLDEHQFNHMSKAQIYAMRVEREEQQRKLEHQDRCERKAIVDDAWHKINRTVNNHPYLTRKQAQVRHDFKPDFQSRLLIPAYSVIGELLGYQYINDAGEKKFKTGSICKAAFYPVMPVGCEIRDLDLIFLAEGYATASSIYQALNEELDSVNYGVFACFSAGQVDNVANAIHDAIGRKSIISIQDNDPAGVKVKTPGFTVGFEPGQDANDIHCEYGLDALCRIIVAKISEMNEIVS